ncbi:hypothetical protein [Nocardioides sp. GXZ039]|uniref:hypothetical protein n=1 Tax=Nocardioides sp. GXZ039 TaxID=3136018 RepID=UPI0030F497C8
MSDDQTTIDGDTKQRVFAALLEQARGGAGAVGATAGAEHDAAEAITDTTTSVDDISQSYEAGDLRALYQESEAHEQDHLAQIEALDTSPADHVRPGAIVGFGGARYVVGVVAEAFDSDGVTYEGISADSPVYAKIDGLQLGDTFEAPDGEHRIDLLG